MSEGYALFVLLYLLYLSECFIWIRKHTVAFITPWRCRWKVAVANSLLGNSRGGLLLLNPFLPRGRVFVCHLLPISLSPTGICLLNLQSFFNIGRPQQSAKCFMFDEIINCSTDGKYLNINNVRLVECASVEQSRALADLIRRGIGMSAIEREKLVRSFVAKRFTNDEASLRLDSEKYRLKHIRISCLIFFVCLYLLVPLLANFYGLEQLILPVALVMIAFAIHISVMFYLAHTALYPDLREDRFTHLAKMILCPPGAIRAVDVLTANLVSSYDPVVIASLLPSSDTERFILGYIRDLRFPISHELTDQVSIEIAQWYKNELLGRALEHLQRTGNRKFDHAFAQPPQDEGCVSYCPRCHCQFKVPSGDCSDCPGVSLIAYLPTATQDETVPNYG